jgi:hypothetical protein
VAGLWNDEERGRVAAALDAQVPGASDLGAVDYVECLLCAFDHDPPRIWAAPGEWSGGPGGWLELGPWEAHAWRLRVDEWTKLWSSIASGATGSEVLDAIAHMHACEATYGDPAYGGNRDEGGWRRVAFPSPMFPPSRGAAS